MTPPTTRRTQGSQVFSFYNADTNIFEVGGKDLEFVDKKLQDAAKNNQDARNYYQKLKANAQEKAKQVAKDTKTLVEERNYNQAQLAYIAGFLDGDGSINISTSKVPRERGYKYLHKHQLTVSFMQKDRRREFLEAIKTSFGGVGTIRQHEKSGTCEYNITDESVSVPLLKLLLPYLRVKKRQAVLAILFAEIPKRDLTVVQFLERAMLVDVLCECNDSKTHKNTAKQIKETLIEKGLMSAEEIESTKFVV